MDPWLLLVLLGLTCFRVTRLVTADTLPFVARPVKAATLWAYRGQRRRWIGDLLQCHWCLSVWVAGALVAVADLTEPGSVPVPLLYWGATAAISATLCEWTSPATDV